jgi:hypothetical protein
VGFFTAVKYSMDYILYTTVDITSTGQYRINSSREIDRWKEQNFQTVLQTIGIRGNITFDKLPRMTSISGTVLGFSIPDIIRVWQFEFRTEREHLFLSNNDPVGFLLDDFEAVPYISGLDECMDQNYDIFVTKGPARNVIFKLRE